MPACTCSLNKHLVNIGYKQGTREINENGSQKHHEREDRQKGETLPQWQKGESGKEGEDGIIRMERKQCGQLNRCQGKNESKQSKHVGSTLCLKDQKGC